MATITEVNVNSKRPVETMVISHESMLEKGLQELISRVQRAYAKNVVGLEVTTVFCSLGDVGKKNKIALLTLCSGLYCLIIQLIHFKAIPSCLARFLDLPYFTFVGVGITKNLMKLKRDYELECRIGVELGSLAAAVDEDKRNYSAYGLLDLRSDLVRNCSLDRSASVVLSDWGTGVLNEDQISHATIDAHESFLIGNKLLGGY